MAIGGQSQKRGGNTRDIIAVTLGSPQGSPQTPLRWLPVTCRRHVPVVYRSLRSQRPYLLKDSSPIQFILFHVHALSLSTAASNEQVVCARTPVFKQHEFNQLYHHYAFQLCQNQCRPYTAYLTLNARLIQQFYMEFNEYYQFRIREHEYLIWLI